jgi:hypothetical protein
LSWILTEVAIQGMPSIKLPRAVEDYFAFAELAESGPGRRFTITFSYLEGARIDRLQWWWQVSPGMERGGESAVATQRKIAIERFHQHIERWLINSGRRITGGDPFPVLEQVEVDAYDSPPEVERPLFELVAAG